MSTNPNDPAAPTLEFYEERVIDIMPGLTKREHFAALAMQGVLADGGFPAPGYEVSFAAQAVRMADALITALNEAES